MWRWRWPGFHRCMSPRGPEHAGGVVKHLLRQLLPVFNAPMPRNDFQHLRFAATGDHFALSAGLAGWLLSHACPGVRWWSNLPAGPLGNGAAQHSTAQHSTAQHSTAHCGPWLWLWLGPRSRPARHRPRLACTMQHGSLRLFTSLPASCFFLSFASHLVCTYLLPARRCMKGMACEARKHRG